MDAEGASDVVAVDVIDDVAAIDANGANDKGSAVVATDAR